MINTLEKIEEKQLEDYSFEVRHKLLKIPRNLYLETLSNYENPFSEEAIQYLVEEYLDWQNDHGLVGMIRINKKNKNSIQLDATIRYIKDYKS